MNKQDTKRTMMSFSDFIHEMYRKDQVKDILKYHDRQADAYEKESEEPGKKIKSRRKHKFHSIQRDRAHTIKRRVSKLLDNKEVKRQAEAEIHSAKKHHDNEIKAIKRDNAGFQRKAKHASKRAKALKGKR